MSTSSFKFADTNITTAAIVAGPFDVTQYDNVAVGISGTYAGINVAFEVSHDNVNWFAVTASQVGASIINNGSSGVLVTNSSNAWDIVVGPFSWFRVRTTAWTSGTGLCQVSGGIHAYEPATNTQTGGDTASGATDSGNPVKVGGLVNQGTPAAKSTGQRADMWVNAQGSPVVASGTTSAVGDADADASSLSMWSSSGVAAGGRPISRPWIFNGATWDKQRTPNVFKSLNAVVVTSETTIWTPTAGKKFRLMGFCLSQGVATGAVTLKDNTAGTTILVIPQNTIGVFMISPPMGNGILSSTINNVLTATGASTETLTGFVFGTEE